MVNNLLSYGFTPGALVFPKVTLETSPRARGLTSDYEVRSDSGRVLEVFVSASVVTISAIERK